MEKASDIKAPAEKATEVVEHQTMTKGDKKKNNSRMMILIAAVLLVVVGGGYAFYANMQKAPAQPQGTIKIGIMGPFTGDAAAYGFAELKGAQLALKDLNAKNIEFIQEDSKCNAADAETSIKRLIAQGVVAIIGEACSGASLAALPFANSSKVVMISPSSTSSSLSIENDYFFRVVPPDDQQGQFIAKSLFDKGIKKAAVFHTDEAYGAGLAKIFTDNFEQLGGTVVVSKPIARDTINVSKEAAEINAAKPEAVAILSNSTSSSVAFMKQYRALGGKAPFFGADGSFDNSIITSGGLAADGLTVTTFPNGTKEFQDAFVAEFGNDVSIYAAAESYDAFQALYMAMQQGAYTGEEIAKVLSTIDFQGISARIKFDKYGNIAGDYNYQVVQVQNGKFVPLSN